MASWLLCRDEQSLDFSPMGCVCGFFEDSLSLPICSLWPQLAWVGDALSSWSLANTFLPLSPFLEFLYPSRRSSIGIFHFAVYEKQVDSSLNVESAGLSAIHSVFSWHISKHESRTHPHVPTLQASPTTASDNLAFQSYLSTHDFLLLRVCIFGISVTVRIGNRL